MPAFSLTCSLISEKIIYEEYKILFDSDEI